MVSALFIALGLVGVTALLCFKGITIRYEKTFTVEDKRNGCYLTPTQIKDLEEEANGTGKGTVNIDPENQHVGSMDGVIATIQDLFGPGISVPDDVNRR